ncbi:MAG: Fe-S cluster assembly protein HesB [Bacteroidota bacterium]
MIRTRLSVPLPSDFRFWRTVYSHGWCSLPPFQVDREKRTLSRLLELEDGTLVRCSVSSTGSRLYVEATSAGNMTAARRGEIKTQLLDCLRVDEDLRSFHAEARKYREYRWIPPTGAGRMLRSPTVFEDVVKMICTTNCSWSLTEAMVKNLTGILGRPFVAGTGSFPSPAALAGVTESFIRKNIRAGYRSPFLLELSERIAGGKLEIESWRKSPLPTGELFRQVRSVKGIGEYAAGNILKLLGRYDFLGLDSWVRGRYYDLHKRGRRVSDKTIEKHYAPYGRWRGLFLWLEVTRDWHE